VSAPKTFGDEVLQAASGVPPRLTKLNPTIRLSHVIGAGVEGSGVGVGVDGSGVEGSGVGSGVAIIIGDGVDGSGVGVGVVG
jgi:hypothetical protein